MQALMGAAADSLIDPGILLTGCFNKLQVSVAAGGQHTCRMHALLVQPGLYVLGVADVQQGQQQLGVCAGPGVGAATVKGALAAAGDSSSAAGRLYYNQDRLYVYVTR